MNKITGYLNLKNVKSFLVAALLCTNVYVNAATAQLDGAQQDLWNRFTSGVGSIPARAKAQAQAVGDRFKPYDFSADFKDMSPEQLEGLRQGLNEMDKGWKNDTEQQYQSLQEALNPDDYAYNQQARSAINRYDLEQQIAAALTDNDKKYLKTN